MHLLLKSLHTTSRIYLYKFTEPPLYKMSFVIDYETFTLFMAKLNAHIVSIIIHVNKRSKNTTNVYLFPIGYRWNLKRTRCCLSLDTTSFRFSAFGHEKRFPRFIGVIYLATRNYLHIKFQGQRLLDLY